MQDATLVSEAGGTASPFRRSLLQLACITLIVAGGTFARVSLNPVQEVLRLSLGLSDNQIGLLQGPALALPMLVAAFPLGLLIDRRSRVRLLAILWAVEVAASIATTFASSFTLLVTLRCIVGPAAFSINPVAISLVSDLFPPAARGRAGMALGIGQFVGTAAVFYLGGMLIARYGSQGDSWRSVLAWLSWPLPLSFLLFPFLHEPLRSEQQTERPSISAAIREIVTLRHFLLPVFAGIVLAECALGGVLSWAGPAFERHFALPPSSTGASMGIVFLLGGVVGPLTGGPLADLCERSGGPRRTLGALALLAAMAALTAASTTFLDYPPAIAALAIFVGLIMMLCVAGTTLFSVAIPNEIRGLCLSALAAGSILIGFGLAPLGVTFLAGVIVGNEALGISLVALSAVTAAMAALLFALARPARIAVTANDLPAVTD